MLYPHVGEGAFVKGPWQVLYSPQLPRSPGSLRLEGPFNSYGQAVRAPKRTQQTGLQAATRPRGARPDSELRPHGVFFPACYVTVPQP